MSIKLASKAYTIEEAAEILGVYPEDLAYSRNMKDNGDANCNTNEYYNL